MMPETSADAGSPVRFVATPEDGVPRAPPCTTGAPAEPTLTASAVATPVPRPAISPMVGAPTVIVAPADACLRNCPAPPVAERSRSCRRGRARVGRWSHRPPRGRATRARTSREGGDVSRHEQSERRRGGPAGRGSHQRRVRRLRVPRQRDDPDSVTAPADVVKVSDALTEVTVPEPPPPPAAPALGVCRSPDRCSGRPLVTPGQRPTCSGPA